MHMASLRNFKSIYLEEDVKKDNSESSKDSVEDNTKQQNIKTLLDEKQFNAETLTIIQMLSTTCNAWLQEEDNFGKIPYDYSIDSASDIRDKFKAIMPSFTATLTATKDKPLGLKIDKYYQIIEILNDALIQY